MSFSATIPAYNHVMNPVWITITGNALKDYTYTVKDSADNDIFFGVVSGTTFKFSISEIVKSLIGKQSASNYLTQGSISRTISNFLAQFSVMITDGTDTVTLSSYAVPGGIPDRLFAAIVNAGSTAFESLFFNTNYNFSLTTRSRNSEFNIQETELVPLALFGYFQQLTIQDGTTVVATVAGENTTIDSLITVSLDAVRKYYMTQTGKLINRFDFYTDGQYSFTVNITESHDNRGYFIVFKNSLGVFEKAQISGELSSEPERDNDTALYKQYDSVTDSLVTRRQRVAETEIIKADMGYCIGERRAWMDDILNSEECWLCIGDNMFECRVSADTLSLNRSKPTPEAFPVKIELIYKGGLFTPYLNNSNVIQRKSIFQDPYTNEYQ